MRPIAVMSAALVLSLSVRGFAQEWIEFASREDGFRVNFPGQPRVTDTTFRSEYGADLPARVYSAAAGPSRYTVTVVDYNHSERILAEKAKSCPAGAERCRGSNNTGAGYSKNDVGGAITYATWQFMQRDAKVTHLMWNWMDLVEGHQLQLTNDADKSRTFASIYMHENKLYIMEGTVPAGYPEPALFQQSLGFVDKEGNGIRYQTRYVNGLPPPPRTGRGGGPAGPAGTAGAGGPGSVR